MTSEEIALLGNNIILWDGLNDAIVGVVERTNFGHITLTDITGKIDLILDKEYYDLEDEEDANIDAWGRENFGPIALYDIHKIIKLLMVDMVVNESELEEGETVENRQYEMALEHFEYNIGGAYVGESTPLHLYLSEK